MVSAIDTTGAKGGGAPPQDELSGKPAEVSNFGILHNYFRDRFFNYFENIANGKWLIIEESLFSVIYFLLSPIPDEIKVVGSSILVSNKVSSLLRYTYFPVYTSILICFACCRNCTDHLNNTHKSTS